MHTVGREETEKGLVPVDPSQAVATQEPEGKPAKRPSKKQASKALKKLKSKIGEGMSMEKLSLKNVVGEHVSVENGFRGVIVTDTLTSMDTCQQIMHDIKKSIQEETDFDKRVRGARAIGEIVGKMSSLLDTASKLQTEINQEKAAPKKKTVMPPAIHYHEHKETKVEPASQSQPATVPVDAEVRDEDEPIDVNPDQEAPAFGSTDASRESRPMSRETPPWENQEEEF